MLQDKMQEYMGNGASLGWLIDPTERVRERLQVLLWLVALALYVLWLLGKAAVLTAQHRHY